MNRSFIDEHHIIQRALWGTNHSDNLIPMERRDHENHHKYLNMLLPHEQLYKVLSLNLTAFRHKTAKELIKVIAWLDEYEIYKDNVIDWDRKHELERIRESLLHPRIRKNERTKKG